MKLLLLITALLLAVPQAVAQPLSVFVSVLPLKFLVERLAGERVSVQVLVGPGQSPATFEPRPRQLADLAGAALFVRVGVPFEQSIMPRIGVINPRLDVVDVRDGLELLKYEDSAESGHAHEAAGHEHGEMDPHVWLDPARVRAMLPTLRDRLITLDPAAADRYRENAQRLQEELLNLEREIGLLLADRQARTFMVFHPSWGYFAERFGLRQVAIEFEGKSPGAKRLAGLVEQARREKIKVIFVQPQFATVQAEALATAIGARVVPLDPLAEDYFENLKRAAIALGDAE